MLHPRVAPSPCALFASGIGHSAVLDPAREERLRRISPTRLFLRKVNPLAERV